MNTIQYSPEAVSTPYVIGLSLVPLESWTKAVSRSLPNLLQGSLGDKPTDHATRLFAIGGVYAYVVKEEYLYSAIYILCVSQSAQARMTVLPANTPCLPFLRKRSPAVPFQWYDWRPEKFNGLSSVGCDLHIDSVHQIWSLCDHKLRKCIRQRKM